MYYLIKDWKISWSSEFSLSSEWYETIQKDFSQEELEKLNSWYLYIDWEIVEWPEVKEFEKQKDIDLFKSIEKQATEKRSQYLTAQLLPEWEYKDLKLEKLDEESEELKLLHSSKLEELKTKYGEEILNELI
jgi:hypothetical protein